MVGLIKHWWCRTFHRKFWSCKPYSVTHNQYICMKCRRYWVFIKPVF